jgi:hypothetical protein
MSRPSRVRTRITRRNAGSAFDAAMSPSGTGASSMLPRRNSRTAARALSRRKTSVRPSRRRRTRFREPLTRRNGPATNRGAVATAVRTYGNRRHAKGSRTTSLDCAGAEISAAANSQCSGPSRSRPTRRSPAAIDGAERHVNVQIRKSALADQPLHRQERTAPVAGSMRSGVAYRARASVVSSRPVAKAGSSGQRKSTRATRTTGEGPAAGTWSATGSLREPQPATTAAATQSAAT